MSHNQYSPLSYNKYFTSNIKDINTFFTNFIELLIYIELLNQYQYLLNGNNFYNFLEFLIPILKKIKFLFNINLDTDIILIKNNYFKKDPYQDEYTPEKYKFNWHFTIDEEFFNPIKEDIKTHLKLDETVESMLPTKIAIKKANMEEFFTDAGQNKMTRCAKDPESDNCRDGAPNLNQMYNEVVGLAPSE